MVRAGVPAKRPTAAMDYAHSVEVFAVATERFLAPLVLRLHRGASPLAEFQKTIKMVKHEREFLVTGSFDHSRSDRRLCMDSKVSKPMG